MTPQQNKTVGKGASGELNKQTQPDPERAPAGSKPSPLKNISSTKELVQVRGLEPAGGALGVWLGLA
jgi:hypothetical protein